MIQAIMIILGLAIVGATTYIIISPKKQEIVKEGYSGTSSKVVATKNEFTGNNKATVVSPEKPIVLKEGFSKPYEANASGNAVPYKVPAPTPDAKPAATPMLVPEPSIQEIPTLNVKKAIKLMEEEVKDLEAELKAVEETL